MKAYDSGVTGRNVRTHLLDEFTSDTFPPVTLTLQVRLPDSSLASLNGRSGVMRIRRGLGWASDLGTGVAESKPRGHCVNVVTLDLTLRCYNLPRFFRQV